jgi:pimeloyl-ACP methyl ester carboxylesterase
MSTQYVNSTDGTQIAYERWGEGPAIVLLHGGGTDRHEWAQAGYVRRLQERFTVLALDLRGHGESDLPTDPADYTPEKYGQDILAVADDCGVKQFTVWGMSFGGKVSRYLAVHSERVSKIVLMGTPMGPGVSGQRRQEAVDFSAHWAPIMEGLQQGTLDTKFLSEGDREACQRLNIPAMLGWVPAMLDWPAVEPADFICPTLWLIGSEDAHAMDTYFQYEAQLPNSLVQVEILEGLGHEQVFDKIDLIFPTLLSFSHRILR